MTDHPQLFDALPAPVEDALRASIERFGVLVPVVRDQHGGMIDGRHRSRIADELGVPYRVDTVRVADAAEAAEIQRTLNADRRHLSGEQLREHIVFLAEQTTPAGIGAFSNRTIADVVGVDEKYVRKTLDNDDELRTSPQLPDYRKGADGKVRPARRPVIVSSRDEAEAEKTQQALSVIPESAAAPERLTANEAQRLAARTRTPEPVKAPVPVPAGQYRAIVLDPPWPMKKIERQERPNQGVELDYPTMPVKCQQVDHSLDDDYIDGIACHEADDRAACKSIECVVGEVVRNAAYDDCHMYLWVTHKFLPAGLNLLEAWGFRYQCVMTWRKNVGITPFSWMYDTEHVLFGTRGNLPVERKGLRLSFEAPVAGHSVKPDVFYDRVTEASPGPRLEMFARRDREGFEAWGNEVAADVV